jgi:hypothetical protein
LHLLYPGCYVVGDVADRPGNQQIAHSARLVPLTDP